MTFKSQYSEEFNDFVKTIVDKIASFEGCLSVEILRDIDDENIFFSYSFWEKKEDLENYRYSAIFREIWTKTKSMFSERAKAWSTELVSQSIKGHGSNNI